MNFFSILIFVAIVFVLWAVGRCFPVFGQSFKEKWPAISDKEFMERCTPGTGRETALKARRIIADQLGVPYEHVYPEQKFVDDLGCG